MPHFSQRITVYTEVIVHSRGKRPNGKVDVFTTLSFSFFSAHMLPVRLFSRDVNFVSFRPNRLNKRQTCAVCRCFLLWLLLKPGGASPAQRANSLKPQTRLIHPLHNSNNNNNCNHLHNKTGLSPLWGGHRTLLNECSDE